MENAKIDDTRKKKKKNIGTPLTERAFRPGRWGSSIHRPPAPAQPRAKPPTGRQGQPCRPGSRTPRRVFETVPVAFVRHGGRRRACTVTHGEGEQESAL